MPKKPNLVFLPNPFNPSEKEEYFLAVGSTPIEWLQKHYPKGVPFGYTIRRNRKELALEDFDVTVMESDMFHLLVRVEDPVTVATTIAVTIVTSFIVAEVAANLVPDNPSSFGPQELQSSPSYNTRSQNNTIRKNEPIPVQYGRFRQFPDLAAVPWFEYIDGKKVIHQLFCLGQGSYEVESIYLGDTFIDEVSGLTAKVHSPLSPIDGFNTNIYTNPKVTNAQLYFRNKKGITTGRDLQLNKGLKRLRATGANPCFPCYLKPGDKVIISANGVDALVEYTGEFEIESLTDDDLFFVDVSAWPGDTNFYGSVYSSTYVSRVLPGTSVEGRSPYNRRVTAPPIAIPKPAVFNFMFTEGYVSAPIGQSTDTFQVDLEFPNGLVRPNGDELAITIAFYARVIDDEDKFVYTVNSNGGPFLPLQVDAVNTLKYYPVEAAVVFIDNGLIIFKDDNGEIPPSEIDIVNYGDDTGGAYVLFNTPRTGDVYITAETSDDDTYKDYIDNVIDSVGITVTRATPDPFLLSETLTIPPLLSATGRYMIYISVTTGDAFNDTPVIIRGFKAVLPTIEYFGPYTFLETSLTATTDTSTLNTEKINIIATRELSRWSALDNFLHPPVATRSIAWAILDVWIASYGGGRSLEHIDVDGLEILDALWTSRGDTFNGVFDQKITVWEAIKKIAIAGRAIPYFDGNKLFIVRDEIKPIRSALFTPENILPNSLTINYAFQSNQDPNGFNVKYLDEALNYQESSVVSNVNADRRRESKFFGVTNYDQVWRESQYLDIAQRLRKKSVTFKTEMSGLLLRPYDRIGLTHDILPSFGQNGYVTGFTSPDQLTVDRSLDFTGVGPWFMMFSREDGSVSGPWEVSTGATPEQAVFESPLPTGITFITELSSTLRTAYGFGEGTEYTTDLLVKTITPNDAYTSTIECVTYDEAIYNADTGVVPSKPPVVQYIGPVPPNVTGLELSNIPGSGIVKSTWNQTYSVSNFEVETSTDFTNWVSVGLTGPLTTTLSFPIVGFTYVRVSAILIGTRSAYTTSSIQAIA